LAEEIKVKQQLTGAKTGIDKAYEHVAAMTASVRGLLEEIDALVRPADEAGAEAARSADSEPTPGAETQPPDVAHDQLADDQLAL
jgi:hypothetical protein